MHFGAPWDRIGSPWVIDRLLAFWHYLNIFLCFLSEFTGQVTAKIGWNDSRVQTGDIFMPWHPKLKEFRWFQCTWMKHRHHRYIICALATVQDHVLNNLNKLDLPVGLIYSLLEWLVTVTCCVFKYFRLILKPEKVHGPPGVQPEIS